MRLANKHAKEHELQAALLGYRKAVQDGVGETEDALSSLNYQNQCLQALHTAFEQQNHLRIMQQKLNQLGLSSEYDGLSGKSTMLQVESELVEAEFKHASAFVTLFKALGGAPLSAVSESLLHTQRAGNDFTRAEITDSRMATFVPVGLSVGFPVFY